MFIPLKMVCIGIDPYPNHPKSACVYASSCKFDVHVETKMNPTFSDKTIWGIFSNIFLVLRVFRTGLHGAQPSKTCVSNWKTMFCSGAEEMRSLFLVRTRMCCCVVQAAANWPWFALSHLLLTNDWNFDTLIGMKRLGGGRSCNKCGPRIERLRQSGTYTVSVTFGGMCTVHFAFEVSLVLLLFAVVTIGKLISM